MNLIPWRNKQSEDSETGRSSLTTLRGEMDRLFDRFVREPFGALEWPFGEPGAWSPTVDVAESDTEITIRAEVPGIEPADLDVTLAERQLVLAGEKKESTEHQGKDYWHTESRFGSFRRSIPLPEAVDPKDVDAQFANGVLTIRLKKSPAAAPKRIEVKVNK
ncbi:MAG: Hsp20/alpha crystallin family protein [Pirellulales bacterium]|nr:Hsp20/alpha crystallin family protein [Pirellulales bacterium]